MTAPAHPGDPLADIRARFEATTHPGWRDSTDTGRLLVEIERLRAENGRLADVLNADDQPLLCPDCVCGDCGGSEGQHAPGGTCSCGCRPACDRFQQDSQLDLLRDAVAPLLGDHPLAEAAAHRVWHALNPGRAEHLTADVTRPEDRRSAR